MWYTGLAEKSKDKKIGLLKRIKQKIPSDKLIIIAEPIFNGMIRYIYLIPTFEKEYLKAQKLTTETSSLQTMQNNMLRVIHRLRISHHVKMQRQQKKIRNNVSKSDGGIPHN